MTTFAVTLDVIRDHVHDLEKTAGHGWPEDTVDVIDRLVSALAEYRAALLARGRAIGSEPDIASDEPDPVQRPTGHRVDCSETLCPRCGGKFPWHSLDCD